MTTTVDETIGAAEGMAVSYPDPIARVNLLPPEILAAREVATVKRRVLLALLAVVLAVVAANGWSRLDDARADRALQAELATVEALRASQAEFIELPMIAAQEATITRNLAVLMVNDTPWDTDLAALRTSALGEIRFIGVDATVRDVGLAAAAGVVVAPGSLDRSGAEQIGVLTVTGRAPNHEAVATWVASLDEVDGFLVPYILGSRVVLDNGGEVEFIVEISLGNALRSLRYEPPAAAAPTAVIDGGS